MGKFVIGYDPGGALANGISCLELSDTLQIRGYDHTNCSTSDEALAWLFDEQKINPEDVIAAGIDTLLSWTTVGTFRPMDYFLKGEYSELANSVFSVNSAFGAMAIQGMVFAHALHRCAPNLQFINETHPKVAYYAQTGRRHDYMTRPQDLVSREGESPETTRKAIKKAFNEPGAVRMWKELLKWINQDAGYEVAQTSCISAPVDDHEWDSLYSAWFTYHYGIRSQSRDLMNLEEHDLLQIDLNTDQTSRIKSLRERFTEEHSLVQLLEQRIIVPCGLEEKVKYLWLPASASEGSEGSA